MKMVKSLLLGTAAGLVAMTGAQAADLPVKAKPVQYVKICSLYGAGFYYIPGTDTCIKIGGWARIYDMWGVNGNSTNAGVSTGNVNTRATTNFAIKSRGYITVDARNQTEWGTVRSYMAVGYSSNGANGGSAGGVTSGNVSGINTLSAYDASSGATGFSANRAFIQFAGFTFGVTQSFYDFYSQSATSFFGGTVNPASDTGDAGKFVTSYTAQFGNGLSSTIGIEAQRNVGILNTNNGMGVNSLGTLNTSPLGIQPASAQEGTQWPDIVANLRIDQAWGAAQVMGALHDATGQYYGANTSTGNPSTAVGWAVGAGIKLNAPMIGPGDYFQAQINYDQGAGGYVNASYNNMYSNVQASKYSFGFLTDAVYGGTVAAGTATSMQLTTSWGVNAAYEHFWNKAWQTSLYGAYTGVSYNSTANGLLCTMETAAAGGMALNGTTCNNNFSYWNIGTRTQWNVDSQTYIGVDVMYTTLKTANSGMLSTLGAGTQPAAVRTIGDSSQWIAQFRVHRNFYP